jgi:hypothetical protein
VQSDVKRVIKVWREREKEEEEEEIVQFMCAKLPHGVFKIHW